MFEQFKTAFHGNPAITEIAETSYGFTYTYGMRFPTGCAVVVDGGYAVDYYEVCEEDFDPEKPHGNVTTYDSVDDLIVSLKTFIEEAGNTL